MLAHLSIRDFILVESCDLSFSRGLTVLTGETGSGKSMILEAICVGLGERAECSFIRPGCDLARIELTFNLGQWDPHHPIWNRLDEYGLRDGDWIRMRRLLSREGRHRFFMNDESVGLNIARQFSRDLLDMHGQFDSLLDPSQDRDWIDRVLPSEDLHTMRRLFQDWKQSETALKNWELQKISREQRFADSQKIVGDLKSLELEEGEEQRIQDEKELLGQEASFSTILADALKLLKASDFLKNIYAFQKTLEKSQISSLPQFSSILPRIESWSLDLSSFMEDCELFIKKNQTSQQRLQDLEDRLYQIRMMARRYGVGPGELYTVYQTAIEHLSQSSLEDQQGILESEQAQHKSQLIEFAHTLKEKRIQTAKFIENSVQQLLPTLKLKETQFQILVSDQEEKLWSSSGCDQIQMLASFNSGHPLRPLHKVVSGGEMSRLLLCLKTVQLLPISKTLILDEIDSGTSGEVSFCMGKQIHQIAEKQQVICITHSPQVAVWGLHHWKICKKSGHIQVSELKKAERVQEIASMLSGTTQTERSQQMAMELLENCQSDRNLETDEF
jgi:DNA repair protein RecN (Recombination protein N)